MLIAKLGVPLRPGLRLAAPHAIDTASARRDGSVKDVDEALHVLEVADPVIVSASVYVVYFELWHLAKNIEPCQPMRAVRPPVQGYIDVTFAILGSGNIARSHGIPFDRARHWLPPENAGLGIVIQARAEVFCGDCQPIAPTGCVSGERGPPRCARG